MGLDSGSSARIANSRLPSLVRPRFNGGTKGSGAEPPVTIMPWAAVALASCAVLILAIELDRRRMQRLVSRALSTPQAVEQAWVSPPDAEGLRRLFVKPVGARARTVAVDFEVDDVIRQFTRAGIKIGYERSDVA